jgi:hypothetical protein
VSALLFAALAVVLLWINKLGLSRDLTAIALIAGVAIIVFAQRRWAVLLSELELPPPGTRLLEPWSSVWANPLPSDEPPIGEDPGFIPDTDAASSDQDPSWSCKACRESNPPTFDVCWSCQAPKPQGR